MTTIKSAVQLAGTKISHVTDMPLLEAEILLTYLLNVPRSFLYAHAEDQLEVSIEQRFNQLIIHRAQGTPIAYLTNQKEFWSLILRVNESTLIPRPETELLVEKALELTTNPTASVLELGTGSGAIAIALAHERPHWHITAIDISQDALAIAQHNAQNYQLNQITFLHSDWFNALPPFQYDIIISNPPYIETSDIHLQQGDVRFEPQLALSSGIDGLTAIRHIIQKAPFFLKSNGFLLMEHGYQQDKAIAHLLKTHHFHQIECFKDLQGHPRVSVGYWK